MPLSTMPFNWTCPYCDRAQTVTSEQCYAIKTRINNDESIHGPIATNIETIRCANEECKKLSLKLYLHEALVNNRSGYLKLGQTLLSWELLPESSAKLQPDYIPAPIVEDYTEACRIRKLSPKASATLSRRCLQGMIRDFCGIKENTLFAEIETLRQQADDGELPSQVLSDTIDAIDTVRKIGNIGAHMGQDIDKIIAVEPNEAQKLIELIELLFHEWYVQRANRTRKLEELKLIGDNTE